MTWLQKIRAQFGGGKPASAPAPVAKSSPEELFKKELGLRASRLDGVERVSELPEEFGLEVWREGSDKPIRVYLANLFRETRDLEPQRRTAQYERFLAQVLADTETPIDWPEASERLIPVIRSEMFNFGGAGPQITRQPLLPALSLWLVLDYEERMMYVSDEQLAKWSVDFATASEAALLNLKKRNVVTDHYAAPDDPIWHVVNDDNYDSSRILMSPWRRAAEQKLGVKLVYAMPDRSSLLFAPLGDDAALARLHEIATREYASAARALSPDLYSEDADGELEPLVLATEHPLYKALTKARVDFEGTEYANQHAELAKLFEKDDIDLFLASFFHVDGEQASHSLCVWSQGVESLLPWTDNVAIRIEGLPDGDKEDTVFKVSRSDLLSIAGAALTVTREYGLPLLHTLRALDEAELSALRARRLS